MIQSELLKEKDRIQKKLSEENPSVHQYLASSHLAAKQIADSYGFSLKYAEVPSKKIQSMDKALAT